VFGLTRFTCVRRFAWNNTQNGNNKNSDICECKRIQLVCYVSDLTKTEDIGSGFVAFGVFKPRIARITVNKALTSIDMAAAFNKAGLYLLSFTM